jgi:galactokinase
VEILKKHVPSVRSLRDATVDLLAEHKDEFDPVVFKRCDYVVRENLRVEAACRDLLAGDFRSFGERMNASHIGLRDDYQVSSPELDAIVEAARKVEGVLGARMMGAGFGGCAISLVEEAAVQEFKSRVGRDYLAATGQEPKIHVVKIEAGTHVIKA